MVFPCTSTVHVGIYISQIEALEKSVKCEISDKMNAIKRCIAVFRRVTPSRLSMACAAAAVLLASPGRAAAQATIVSVAPPTGTSGVSPTDPVVFTFSEPMDTNVTLAQFYTSIATPPYAYYYTNTVSWSASSNVLTCTPVPSFTPSAFVVWTVSGSAVNGDSLKAPRSGHFTTASNAGGTGTNAVTTFVIERANLYDQSSIAQPAPDPVEPYLFIASTSLASNQTANSVTLTLPNAAVSNLEQNPTAPEDWNFGTFSTNASVLDTNFPPGTYTFTINAGASNQTVEVNFPGSLSQPDAPHVNNFAALQSVDSTQPFTLQWDEFAGGTSTDYIVVTVATVWQTPNPGSSNALSGTATSVTIPAGTLAPGETYTASVGFSHNIFLTNGTYTTEVYRATDTTFSLTTAAAATTPIVLTNVVLSGGALGFDVLTSSGQTVTVLSTTNLATPLPSWSVRQTFTNPGTSFHFTDPQPTTNQATFYRARSGN